MVFMSPQEDAVTSAPLIWISEQGSDRHLLYAVDQMIAAGAKGLMILACSANNHSANNLQTSLETCVVPICGGVFPSIFLSESTLDVGFIIVGFRFEISVFTYPFSTSDDVKFDLKDCANSCLDLIVFADAMASKTEIFISSLYEALGGGINVIGGGAGSIDFEPRPCIFSPQGLIMDAALMVQLTRPMTCAVEHGWEILSGPYLVTESESNRIKTLNYLPAYHVYKTLIEEKGFYKFASDNFFQVSKNFPLGILGINDDILVRDPIQVNNNELICVGSVSVNSMIYILHGVHNNIISAAENVGALLREKTRHASNPSGLSVVFDCVSRVLYLGEKFPLEIAAIRRGLGEKQIIVGALSIGEIANTNCGTINLLNKSIVIGNI